MNNERGNHRACIAIPVTVFYLFITEVEMKRRVSLIILPVYIALLAVLFLTAPVYAQEEVPPEVPPEEVPEETPPDELAPVLEEAAETGVVLVDESGEPFPLADEETAETLAGGDPYYKVGTKTYYFRFPGECGTTPNCFESTTPISEAIDHISTTGLPSDGMIYIEGGNYTESAQVDPLTMDPILSGLKGLIGTVIDGIPQVHLTSRIIVYDVDLGFTIKGFNCTDMIEIHDSLGTLKIEDVIVDNNGGMGIFITNHNGTVILNRVEADGNRTGGAYINNAAGTAGVTVTNSSFNHNGSEYTNRVGGLTIITKGSVNLDGVTAIGNYEDWGGLFIQQSGAISIKNSIFSNNTGSGLTNDYMISAIEPTKNITLQNVILDGNDFGLFLRTKGNISLTNVSASHNAGYGASIDTCVFNGTDCSFLGTGAITIKNGTFDDNSGDTTSLTVIARGAITLTGVSASGTIHPTNDPKGAWLNNRYSQLVVPVKITSGTFDHNDGTGLTIDSRGAITLSQVFANGSVNLSGVVLDNTYGTTAGVTITSSTFNNNHGAGLTVDTNGTITLTSIQAIENGAWGAMLRNFLSTSTPGVTIKGSTTAYNLFNNNGYDGITIDTKGAVTLSYAQVDGNDSYGAEIFNDKGKGGVTISNALFNSNVDSNLLVAAKGAIKISNFQANSSVFGYGAELVNSNSAIPQGVTISNATIWNNYGIGLNVVSKGNFILTNVAGWDNGFSGAYLDNSLGTGYVKITNLKSTDTSIQRGFDNNSTGLSINTNGTAALTNVNAIGNQYDGIYIYGTYQKGATLTNCRVEGNATEVGAMAGIRISSMGPVTISGGYSNSNSKVGLRIDNTSALDTAPKPVTIKNFTANNNVDRGIYVLSRGAISLTSVTANDISGASQIAIELDNTAQTANVTLSKVKANGNIYRGIQINSKGAVKVSSAESSHNGYLGLYVYTQGMITVTNVIANDNGNFGALLNNQTSTTNAGVTVTGSTGINSFSGNGDTGLEIDSRGKVILNNITADKNYYMGIYVYNYNLGNGYGTVTISNIVTRYNLGSGLGISSDGNVTLKGVVSMLNGGHGVQMGTYDHNLSIYSSVFSGNQLSGIYADIGSGIFTMSSTMYFGNDTDNTGDPNLLIIH